MLSDFKFAFRALTKTPGFTAIAVVTLALAIGVNSAVFALVNGLVLRPLVPLRPAEIVNVFTARKGASKDYRQFSHTEYLALREAKDAFADVGKRHGVGAGDMYVLLALRRAAGALTPIIGPSGVNSSSRSSSGA